MNTPSPARPYRSLPTWALVTMAVAYREGDRPRQARLVQNELDARTLDMTPDIPWADHFPLMARAERRPLPDPSSWLPLDEAAVCGIFAPQGPLAALMPGYEPRPGQVEMAGEIARALNERRHVMIEAGTGVGKSLAYLVPAALWAYANGVPVVVSTNTRNLQSQLLSKDVPVMKAALERIIRADRPLRTAVLKGRSNYLCLRTLGFLIEHGVTQLEREELIGFAQALPWIATTVDGDLDDLSAAVSQVETSGIGRQLGSVGEECLGRGCRFFRRCFLQKARQRAAESHVVIANHALVFTEMRVPGSALPAYAQIVFDEAHNLEEAATRHLTVEITPYRLFQLTRRLSSGKPGMNDKGLMPYLRKTVVDGAMLGNEPLRVAMLAAIAELLERLPGFAKAGVDLFSLLYRFVEKNSEPCRYRTVALSEQPPVYRREIVYSRSFVDAETVIPEAEIVEASAAFSHASRAITDLLGRMADMIDRLTPEGQLPLCADQAASVLGMIAQIKEFHDELAFLLAANDPHYVFWIERRGSKDHQAQLLAAPLSIAKRLAEALYKEKSSVVFCSATLRVRNEFNHIGKRLGTSLLPETNMPGYVAESPFDYPGQCAVCVPEFLPEPSAGRGGDDAYVLELSRMMYRLFVQTKGRALGLFTSYEMMTRAAALLEKPLAEKGIRLLVQSSGGSRDRITRLFRANEEASVLFGTHSFWEGVDVVGDALSCVVMARLPFDAVNDPLLEARCEQITRDGGAPFRELTLPQAVIRFRQGFGRLIRSKKDRGLVVVADSRITKKNYGSSFSQSLPVAPRPVKTLEELLRVSAAYCPSE